MSRPQQYASKCECGHAQSRHCRRATWAHDLDPRHCLPCTCPQYKFLTKASISAGSAGLRRYPRRERTSS